MTVPVCSFEARAQLAPRISRLYSCEKRARFVGSQSPSMRPHSLIVQDLMLQSPVLDHNTVSLHTERKHTWHFSLSTLATLECGGPLSPSLSPFFGPPHRHLATYTTWHQTSQIPSPYTTHSQGGEGDYRSEVAKYRNLRSSETESELKCVSHRYWQRAVTESKNRRGRTEIVINIITENPERVTTVQKLPSTEISETPRSSPSSNVCLIALGNDPDTSAQFRCYP